MEYIEGETLEARVSKGPLKLDEAVRIASAVASGLGAAHRKDIVHRDIKAANIMLDEDGTAKILDFGLAQTAASTKLTRMGSTLGTVAYMSPEQTRGEQVFARTDIWSLGAVLYEMIAGRAPFGGGYEQALIYSILNEDPEPLTALRTGVPMELERIVGKCLKKQPELRYQNADDLIIDLEAIQADLRIQQPSGSTRIGVVSGSQHGPKPGPKHGPRSSSEAVKPAHQSANRQIFSPSGFALLTAAVVLGIMSGWWLFASPGLPVPGISTRTSIVLPDGLPVALIGSSPYYTGRKAFDLSRDGQWLAYDVEMPSGGTQIAVRAMDSYEFKVISGTDGAYSPFFSPDASHLGFFADNQLKVVPVDGGAVRPLTDVRIPGSAIWHESGDIIFIDSEIGSIIRVSPENGDRLLVREGYHRTLSPIPGSDHLLTIADDSLAVVSLSTGTMKTLAIGGSLMEITSPSFVSSGYVLYTRGSDLLAVSFDKASLEVTGVPFSVLSEVRQEALALVSQYRVSDTGTLVYVQGGEVRVAQLLSVSLDGEVKELPFEPLIYGEMRLSPDNSLLAICVYTNKWNIWMYDLVGGREPERFTFDGNNYNPVWSPDGETLYFNSDRTGAWRVYAKSVLSSGAPAMMDVERRITVLSWFEPESVSPDNKWILIAHDVPGLNGEISAVSLDSTDASYTIGSSP